MYYILIFCNRNNIILYDILVKTYGKTNTTISFSCNKTYSLKIIQLYDNTKINNEMSEYNNYIIYYFALQSI